MSLPGDPTGEIFVFKFQFVELLRWRGSAQGSLV